MCVKFSLFLTQQWALSHVAPTSAPPDGVGRPSSLLIAYICSPYLHAGLTGVGGSLVSAQPLGDLLICHGTAAAENSPSGHLQSRCGPSAHALHMSLTYRKRKPLFSCLESSLALFASCAGLPVEPAHSHLSEGDPQPCVCAGHHPRRSGRRGRRRDLRAGQENPRGQGVSAGAEPRC